ncbi:hypothetical protein EJ06DRAFT_551013 [Trichodelitschia bisporula]|uniref:SMP-LTD domain-containing protein n=1 Tax=Trichodelitschia bisporula TaxID=703511 RepID=A0A6G1HNR8_9PEZI|nr:hypothetical protein EJ06DRAFT_551013 [Trichodelitschia bisporula]
MSSFGAFILTYLLGGLTFIPLVLIAVVCHGYITFPIRKGDTASPVEETRTEPGALDASKLELAALPSEVNAREHEPDVAAGFFAVCREFIPGGISGKPPERGAPAGSATGVESPSVYQNMYRSIFERNKAQSPALDASNDGGKVAKRSRNVFYVVLRHGHLMLYDDDHQLEVRHVISLALYDIDVYAGGGEIPEGELWVKRNCIRLQRRNIEPDMHHDPKPYFMFAENCSDKEDFYHALLLNQERTAGVSGGPPRPQPLSSKDVVKLVQLLHASEENIQTRWINALIGRLFLSLYKTAGLKKFVHGKISKKILRVQKPAFITSLQVRNIDMGDCAPLITNPRLKELTLDGDLTVEMDVKYHGNFRLEIAAVARIELGSRFKAREVDLVLAGICKRLDGHLLVRIKPPPSNRIWISFEHMPTLEMSIEPIVSSRQITYGVILRAIESRIREVIADTLVLPNWDDVPFSDTAAQAIRGGIWMDETASPLFSSENLVGTDGAEDDVAKGSVDATPNTNAAASSDDLQEPPTSSRRRRTSPAPLWTWIRQRYRPSKIMPGKAKMQPQP